MIETFLFVKLGEEVCTRT